MHFTVLSALALPQDIPAAASSIPVGEVIGFIESKFLLAQLFRDKAISPLKPDTTMIDAMRWEYLAELMVAKLLAPYNENNEDITYMEFDDRTNEGRTAYEQSGVDCVKTLDGRIIPCHNHEFGRRYELYDGKVYRRRFGPLHHRKQTKKSKRYLALPDYPFRKLFPTAEVFMTEYWGCVAGGKLATTATISIPMGNGTGGRSADAGRSASWSGMIVPWQSLANPPTCSRNRPNVMRPLDTAGWLELGNVMSLGM